MRECVSGNSPLSFRRFACAYCVVPSLTLVVSVSAINCAPGWSLNSYYCFVRWNLDLVRLPLSSPPSLSSRCYRIAWDKHISVKCAHNERATFINSQNMMTMAQVNVMHFDLHNTRLVRRMNKNIWLICCDYSNQEMRRWNDRHNTIRYWDLHSNYWLIDSIPSKNTVQLVKAISVIMFFADFIHFKLSPWWLSNELRLLFAIREVGHSNPCDWDCCNLYGDSRSG